MRSEIAWLVISAGIALASVAAAQGAGNTENDKACAMITTYAKMGVDHARLVPLAPFCAKSPHCASARQTMTSAGRPDVDMLNCDHAPALDPHEAAAERESANDDLGEAQRACAMIGVYGKMGVGLDAVKALVPKCAKNPDPKIICTMLMIFKAANRPNPGLICTDPSFSDPYYRGE
jgi:hypothetical protein